MHLRLALLAALLSSACASYDSIEEACPDNLGGSNNASDSAVHYFERVNCYRRYAGMYKVRVQPDLQEAVSNHVKYMNLHYDPAVGLPLSVLISEDPGMPGFTGANDFERIEATGNTMITATSLGAWLHASIDLPETDDKAGWSEQVDQEMAHFVYRQKFLQPSSWGVGLDVAGPWRYSFELYRFPANERMDRPVVYPIDGQVEVPLSTFNPWEGQGYPLPAGDQGYHITVTVGGASGSSWLAMNPYDLQATDIVLQDEAGDDVEFILVTPDHETPGAFLFTVAIVPRQPLQPNTTYTFSAHLEWDGRVSNVDSTFTTAAQ